MEMAGVVTGGEKGRRLKVEKPMAGLRAWGAARMLVRIEGVVEVICRTWDAHIRPNIAVMVDWNVWSWGVT